jgi:hypothetical protein
MRVEEVEGKPITYSSYSPSDSKVTESFCARQAVHRPRDSKGVSSEDGAAILNEEARHAVILCRTECKKPDIILSNNKTNVMQLPKKIFMKDYIHKPYTDRYDSNRINIKVLHFITLYKYILVLSAYGF